MKKSGNRKAESGKRKTGNGGPGSADVLVGRYEPIDSSLGPQPHRIWRARQYFTNGLTV